MLRFVRQVQKPRHQLSLNNSGEMDSSFNNPTAESTTDEVSSKIILLSLLIIIYKNY